ncbi:hypothetical protein SAMN02927937_02341 [Paenimyroides aquimaris]|uniref:Uncharacterized protein n=1 Tax=Paenimyroides marinum TaxID=1159016 RepID=A0A1H6MBI2_9FLAO|nr:hypothetical protein [Paenimyroides aquimaris]SEH95092.1 hypothetical protein SAMN02927937_02341 [Paenimyroides aquimaris]
MIKVLTRLIPLFFITVMGFYTLFGIDQQKNAEDWVGIYEPQKPNLIERKFLFRTYNLKGAYFADKESAKVILSSDFSLQRVINDSIVYEAKWELIKENPLLHFTNKDHYFKRIKLSNKVYYYEKVKTCQGDSIDYFVVFKKIK